MMTRTQQGNWKKYCSEPLELIENFEAAKADDFKGWVMHHRREINEDGTRVLAKELKRQGLYFHRPASELVFMRHAEHSRLHSIGNVYTRGMCLSAETRKKMSKAKKGKTLSTAHRQKLSEVLTGRHLPDIVCQKIAEANKGKTFSEEHCQKISQANIGRHWWNNEISSKFARECPGPDWKRGYLKKS